MKLGSMMRRLKRLSSDERGNVMVMFSFAMVPVIGLTGATIDYSRASDARQMLNAAVDSAALQRGVFAQPGRRRTPGSARWRGTTTGDSDS